MPRTKITRKGTQKRIRRSSVEEKEMKLREFEALVENTLSDLEDLNSNSLQEVTEEIYRLKQKISKRVLNMQISEIREKDDIRSIFDLTVISSKDLNATAASDISTIASLSLVGEKIRMKEMRTDTKRSHQDEGYLTEEGSQSNRSSGVGSYKSSQSSYSGRVMGPLASAKARERRSRSAGPAATPLKTSMLVGTKSSKNLLLSQGRAKYKTPMNNKLTKTQSMDRLIITPKVQPDYPMAIVRRANVGETVFSVTGSPVISSSGVEDVANVNIPVANGILSIRPTQLNLRDTDIVNNMDCTTLEQLKTLQQNLNKLMHAAEKRNFNRGK